MKFTTTIEHVFEAASCLASALAVLGIDNIKHSPFPLFLPLGLALGVLLGQRLGAWP